MQAISTNKSYSNTKANALSHNVALEHFLKTEERKAFQMAIVATADQGESLDIVQDAMLRFVTHYASKPESEWVPLFYRIVQNLIVDWHRKQKVRKIILFWQESEETPMPTFFDHTTEPEHIIEKQQKCEQSLNVLHNLPLKQQQCFLLRAWQGLSVKQTAHIMKCSEGSVKTHFSRASAKLKQLLESNHDHQ